jgi:hypothetical protein
MISVSDRSSRAPILDATVSVQRDPGPHDASVEPQVARFACLDADYYIANEVCSGSYSITVEHPAYQPVTIRGRAALDRDFGTSIQVDRYDVLLTPRGGLDAGGD